MAARQLQPNYNHNLTVLEELEEGDLIEFKRGCLYSHWAVYCGEGKVIHVTVGGQNGSFNSGSALSCCGKSTDKAVVRIDKFWDVVSNSRAEKNNSKDRTRRPLRPAEIIRKAKEGLGKIGYNVLWRNCEHFATDCRYGSGESDQANNFFIGAGVVTVAAAGLGAYIGLARSRRTN